jgi:Tol biopolymer transport system component
LLESSQAKQAFDWSPDGRFVIYRTVDPKTNYDLWILPLHGDRKPFPFLVTRFQELDAQFSPDGRWVAYASNESGRFETYVQPFPGPGGKWQVSDNGGVQPRWRRDGKELFYVAADSKLMAVPVNVSTDGKSFESGKPQTLFTTRMFSGGVRNAFRHQYDVSKDGQRFLINAVSDEAGATPITVILNWRPKS